MEATEVKIQVYIITVILLLLGVFIFLFFISYTTKQKAHQKKVLELNEELLRTQLEIQEQTFKTISQEIHDNIGQMLSLAKINLNRVETEKLEKDKEKIKDAKELVSKAIQDLRDLSRTLNTETIASVGLLKAIEMELHLLEKADAVQTKLEIRGVPARLDPQKELILFRISQEALHNIIKHAAASAIRVEALFEKGNFLLVISDNGRGFDSTLNHHAGSGLRNMQSRSRLIGATWNMVSSPECGTQINISLPINNEHGDNRIGG